MARSKQASKRKGRRRSLPLAGAAVSLAFAGGASATAPTEHLPPQDTPRPVITLSEEEISDVNLGTFYVFDKENVEFGEPVQLARRGWEAAGAAQRAAVEAARCAAVRAGCGGCGCGCATGCRLWTGSAWVYVC